MCVYIYIYMYICLCIYIHIYVYICTPLGPPKGPRDGRTVGSYGRERLHRRHTRIQSPPSSQRLNVVLNNIIRGWKSACYKTRMFTKVSHDLPFSGLNRR